MLGWILFGLLLVWFFISMRHSVAKRLHLGNYIVYLLLMDDIRNDHKEKFIDWIAKTDAKNAQDIALQASSTVEEMAEQLAENSTLACAAMLWKLNQERSVQA